MHIENLSLIGFKNYEEATLTFDEKLNFICGPNGSGKTNILEAIHYLCMTRGAHNTIDSQNVKKSAPYFSLKGHFIKESAENEIVCYYQEGSKKSFKVDRQDYEKLSEHIGKFPVVLIAPNDSDLIRDGSEIRRKFVDTILCQTDRQYLISLQKYNHNLKQRNALLKQLSKSGSKNESLLDKYDDWLISYGDVINKARVLFIDNFSKTFLKEYDHLCKQREKVHIDYKSDFNESSIKDRVFANRSRDILLERTTLGIHRDDFKFYIEDQPLKKFGSQGQQKTFSIALKLAQFHFMHEAVHLKPLLLLDDIFDKLDMDRIKKLLTIVGSDHFGQVIITDAIADRIRMLSKELKLKAKFIMVQEGNISSQ